MSGAPCPAPDTEVFAAPPSSAEPVLPLLRHVGRRGNTTVYEWRTGLEPVRVERPEVQEVPEQPKEDAVRAALRCCGGLGRLAATRRDPPLPSFPLPSCSP